MDITEQVVKHADWIRRKTRQFFADKDEADDLASETIYRCLCNGAKFHKGRSFKPWALTIMSNIYITWYNRRQCVLFTGLDDYDPYSNETEADQAARVNRIISIIRECNRKSCSIECVLLHAKGYSYEEISGHLNIPTGTVKSRISTARKMIWDALN